MNVNNTTTVLCITGMHRSGTSLTASWLEHCGLSIHDGNYCGPDTGNPKGHFEDKDFVNLHSSAILQDSPRSRGWKIVAKKFLTFTGERLSYANMLVDQRNEKYELWGWKDPRSVIYLKHWKEIIPSLKVLFVWRPCSQVTQSLTERSRKSKNQDYKVNVSESVRIWMSYNKRVCEYKQLYPDDTLLFPLEYLITNSQNVLNRLKNKFGINLRYRCFDDVYDQNILNRRSESVLTRFACLCYRSNELKERLQNLSDIEDMTKSF